LSISTNQIEHYTYDLNGNQQTITNNVTGVVTTYAYNLANMVSGIENKLGKLPQALKPKNMYQISTVCKSKRNYLSILTPKKL